MHSFLCFFLRTALLSSAAGIAFGSVAIWNIRMDAITHSSARVGWTLRPSARSYIEYGRTTSYGYRTIELAPTSELERVWLMTGMAPATTYHFRIKAIDAVGAITYSPDQTVTTLPAPPHPVLPELPRQYVDTAMPVQTGVKLNVASDCSNLMQTIGRATWGDTVIVPAGATCTGRFVFPAKAPDTQVPHRWIVIRTSASDSVLPPDGVRISPSWKAHMPRFVLNTTTAPHETAPGAHHYRFIGIEFTTADPSAYYQGNIVNTTPTAHHVVLDRCYIHGFDYPGATRRSVVLDGSHVALINSHLEVANHNYYGFALLVEAGPGPGKVYNNFIQGPGITMFWTDNVPTPDRNDYEIRRNWIYGNERYKLGSSLSNGRHYMHRQPLELKRGRRFLIDGNVFDNWWADEQGGSEVMLFTPRGGFRFDGNEYEIADISITNNLLRRVPGGIAIAALNVADAGGDEQTRVTKRFRIANNLMASLDGMNACCDWASGARGLVLRLQSGVEDVIFEHNTVYRSTGTGPRLLSLNDEAMEGLHYVNNIVWFNNAFNIGGLFFSGTYPTGAPTPWTAKGILDGWAVRAPDPFYTFSNNVIPGTNIGDTARYQGQFPPGNFWPGDGALGEAAIMFQNAPAGDFRLRPESRYKFAGTDRRDIGVDMDVLERAIGVVKSVAAVTTSSSAAISYTAPDVFACAVEISNTADLLRPTRKTDSGGVRSRSVVFDKLLPATNYYYRVLCASDQPSNRFRTQ